jgi:hypothetical protein
MTTSAPASSNSAQSVASPLANTPTALLCDDAAPQLDASPAGALTPRDPMDFSDLIALAHPHAHGAGHRDPLWNEYAPLPEPNERSYAGMLVAPFEDDAADPLAGLAAEYQQALLLDRRGAVHDYQHYEAHELESTFVDNTPIVAPPPDPFSGAPEHDARRSLIDDLLGSQQSIDAVIGSLDPFGAEHIFTADPHCDILALFAGGGAPATPLSRPALLAREEHHLLTADSNIQMPESVHITNEEPSRK